MRSMRTVKKMTAKRERAAPVTGAIAGAARIGPPTAPPQDRVVVDSPRQGGECLRFPRDAPTAPRGERDEPLAPQAPESSDAVHDPDLDIALGKGASERGQ